MYNEYSILIERKSGEFYEGIKSNIIDKETIIPRNLFLQLISTSRGEVYKSKKAKYIFNKIYFENVFSKETDFRKYYFAILAYKELLKLKEKKEGKLITRFKVSKFAALSVALQGYNQEIRNNELKENALFLIEQIISKWEGFEDYVVSRFHNQEYFDCKFYFRSKRLSISTNWGGYYTSTFLPVDLNNFFNGGEIIQEEVGTARNTARSKNKYHKTINGFSFEKIREIVPLINTEDFYDEKSILEISKKLKIEKSRLIKIIKLITSRKEGFYIYQKYKQRVID